MTKAEQSDHRSRFSLMQFVKLFWRSRVLHSRERWTRMHIREHQEEELQRLRRFAYDNSPFYKKFHQGLENSSIHELPILTKQQLMHSWDEIVTDRTLHLKDIELYLDNLKGPELYDDTYRAAATGGTTGVKGIVVHNKQEWLQFFSSAMRTSGWSNMPISFWKKPRLAIVQSLLPWHVAGAIGLIKIPVVKMLPLDVVEPLEEVVHKLNDFKPHVLAGFAGNIHQLAQEQLAARLHISPGTVITTAETLKKEARHAIERAWGTQPFETYASTETGVIASECEAHNGLHIYEDLVFIEVVDNDNKPVPVGEYGNKVLVTVFWSRTLPLIRYEISDHLKLDSNLCSCGRTFTLIKEIQGREENVIYLPGQKRGEVAIQPDVFFDNMVLLPIDGWQVVQERDDAVTFLILGAHPDFSESDFLKRITDELAKQGAKPPAVKVEYIKELRRTPLGKTITIQSLKKGGK